MKHLWEVGYFLRLLRAKLKYGEMSRSPLRLLRVEWQGDAVECDWMARPPDPWDADLPVPIRERNESLQSLKDAMTVRDVVFSALPGVRTAKLRVYREVPHEPLHLIIAGSLSREDSPPIRIPSLVMRAKLSGLTFCLNDGVLGDLE